MYNLPRSSRSLKFEPPLRGISCGPPRRTTLFEEVYHPDSECSSSDESKNEGEDCIKRKRLLLRAMSTNSVDLVDFYKPNGVPLILIERKKKGCLDILMIERCLNYLKKKYIKRTQLKGLLTYFIETCKEIRSKSAYEMLGGRVIQSTKQLRSQTEKIIKYIKNSKIPKPTQLLILQRIQSLVFIITKIGKIKHYNKTLLSENKGHCAHGSLDYDVGTPRTGSGISFLNTSMSMPNYPPLHSKSDELLEAYISAFKPFKKGSNLKQTKHPIWKTVLGSFQNNKKWEIADKINRQFQSTQNSWKKIVNEIKVPTGTCYICEKQVLLSEIDAHVETCAALQKECEDINKKMVELRDLFVQDVKNLFQKKEDSSMHIRKEPSENKKSLFPKKNPKKLFKAGSQIVESKKKPPSRSVTGCDLNKFKGSFTPGPSMNYELSLESSTGYHTPSTPSIGTPGSFLSTPSPLRTKERAKSRSHFAFNDVTHLIRDDSMGDELEKKNELEEEEKENVNTPDSLNKSNESKEILPRSVFKEEISPDFVHLKDTKEKVARVSILASDSPTQKDTKDVITITPEENEGEVIEDKVNEKPKPKEKEKLQPHSDSSQLNKSYLSIPMKSSSQLSEVPEESPDPKVDELSSGFDRTPSDHKGDNETPHAKRFSYEIKHRATSESTPPFSTVGEKNKTPSKSIGGTSEFPFRKQSSDPKLQENSRAKRGFMRNTAKNGKPRKNFLAMLRPQLDFSNTKFSQGASSSRTESQDSGASHEESNKSSNSAETNQLIPKNEKNEEEIKNKEKEEVKEVKKEKLQDQKRKVIEVDSTVRTPKEYKSENDISLKSSEELQDKTFFRTPKEKQNPKDVPQAPIVVTERMPGIHSSKSLKLSQFHPISQDGSEEQFNTFLAFTNKNKHGSPDSEKKNAENLLKEVMKKNLQQHRKFTTGSVISSFIATKPAMLRKKDTIKKMKELLEKKKFGVGLSPEEKQRPTFTISKNSFTPAAKRKLYRKNTSPEQLITPLDLKLLRKQSKGEKRGSLPHAKEERKSLTLKQTVSSSLPGTHYSTPQKEDSTHKSNFAIELQKIDERKESRNKLDILPLPIKSTSENNIFEQNEESSDKEDKKKKHMLTQFKSTNAISQISSDSLFNTKTRDRSKSLKKSNSEQIDFESMSPGEEIYKEASSPIPTINRLSTAKVKKAFSDETSEIIEQDEEDDKEETKKENDVLKTLSLDEFPKKDDVTYDDSQDGSPNVKNLTIENVQRAVSVPIVIHPPPEEAQTPEKEDISPSLAMCIRAGQYPETINLAAFQNKKGEVSPETSLSIPKMVKHVKSDSETPISQIRKDSDSEYIEKMAQGIPEEINLGSESGKFGMFLEKSAPTSEKTTPENTPRQPSFRCYRIKSNLSSGLGTPNLKAVKKNSTTARNLKNELLRHFEQQKEKGGLPVKEEITLANKLLEILEKALNTSPEFNKNHLDLEFLIQECKSKTEKLNLASSETKLHANNLQECLNSKHKVLKKMDELNHKEKTENNFLKMPRVPTKSTSQNSLMGMKEKLARPNSTMKLTKSLFKPIKIAEAEVKSSPNKKPFGLVKKRSYPSAFPQQRTEIVQNNPPEEKEKKIEIRQKRDSQYSNASASTVNTDKDPLQKAGEKKLSLLTMNLKKKISESQLSIAGRSPTNYQKKSSQAILQRQEFTQALPEQEAELRSRYSISSYSSKGRSHSSFSGDLDLEKAQAIDQETTPSDKASLSAKTTNVPLIFVSEAQNEEDNEEENKEDMYKYKLPPIENSISEEPMSDFEKRKLDKELESEKINENLLGIELSILKSHSESKTTPNSPMMPEIIQSTESQSSSSDSSSDDANDEQEEPLSLFQSAPKYSSLSRKRNTIGPEALATQMKFFQTPQLQKNRKPTLGFPLPVPLQSVPTHSTRMPRMSVVGLEELNSPALLARRKRAWISNVYKTQSKEIGSKMIARMRPKIISVKDPNFLNSKSLNVFNRSSTQAAIKESEEEEENTTSPKENVLTLPNPLDNNSMKSDFEDDEDKSKKTNDEYFSPKTFSYAPSKIIELFPTHPFSDTDNRSSSSKKHTLSTFSKEGFEAAQNEYEAQIEENAQTKDPTLLERRNKNPLTLNIKNVTCHGWEKEIRSDSCKKVLLKGKFPSMEIVSTDPEIKQHEYEKKWNDLMHNRRASFELDLIRDIGEIEDDPRLNVSNELEYKTNINDLLEMSDDDSSEPIIRSQSMIITPSEMKLVRGENFESFAKKEISGVGKKISIDDFKILKGLSSGAFGVVCLAEKKSTGNIYAIKILDRKKIIEKNQIDFVQTEKDILKLVSNDFVVKGLYTFQSEKFLYFVMEYMVGGDIGALLEKVDLDEDQAKKYLAEIVLALEHLHRYNIIHRDLKPDNVLIDSSGHIKLTDFGLSELGLQSRASTTSPESKRKESIPEESDQEESSPSLQIHAGGLGGDEGGLNIKKLKTEDKKGKYIQDLPHKKSQALQLGKKRNRILGTPDYIAPEVILEKEHTTAVDYWSLGVMAFELLTGKLPFNSDTREKIFDNILNLKIDWDIDPEIKAELSDDAFDFIKALLVLDPSKRLGALGAQEIKNHPFFEGINWDTIRSEEPVFVPQIDDILDPKYLKEDKSGFSTDIYQRGRSDSIIEPSTENSLKNKLIEKELQNFDTTNLDSLASISKEKAKEKSHKMKELEETLKKKSIATYIKDDIYSSDSDSNMEEEKKQ